MANNSGMQVLLFGSSARTGFKSEAAGVLMTSIMNDELKKRIVPQIKAAYDIMSEGWSEKPTPTIKVGQDKSIGNFVEVSFKDSTIANKRWLMVDTLGRKGGARIQKKIAAFEVGTFDMYGNKTRLSEGSFVVSSSGKGFKKKELRLGIGEGKMPIFKTGKGLVSGIANRPPLHFQPQYSPKTWPLSHYGGPGTKSGPWVTKLQVRQGRVRPRRLSRNVLRALQGKGSPLNSVITPWFSDSGPTRAAYRKAFQALTGRRI